MKAHRIHISKVDAARRQLESAITLYFANGDFVSVHTLAYAAFSITRNLCDRHNSPESFTAWVEANVCDTQKKELWKHLNAAGNYFKHADRDALDVLEYYPEQYEFFMIYAILQFAKITNERPIHFHVFEIWFLIHNPGWSKTKVPPHEIEYIKSELPKERAAFYNVVSTELRKRERHFIEHNPPCGRDEAPRR